MEWMDGWMIEWIKMRMRNFKSHLEFEGRFYGFKILWLNSTIRKEIKIS